MNIYDLPQKPKHNLASRIAQAILPIHLQHFMPEGSQPNRFDYVRKVNGISYVLGYVHDQDIKGAMNYLGASLLIIDSAVPNYELSQQDSVLLNDRMGRLIIKTTQIAHKGDTVLYTPHLFLQTTAFQACVHRIK